MANRRTTVQVLGVKEAIGNLNRLGKAKLSAVNKAIHDSGFILKGEIQQSISGNRSEPRSVDTGRLGNDIQLEKKGTAHVIIEPKGNKYPGGATTKEVAKWLEYGTSKISPRRHFRNSLYRKKPDIILKIQTAVK